MSERKKTSPAKRCVFVKHINDFDDKLTRVLALPRRRRQLASSPNHASEMALDPGSQRFSSNLSRSAPLALPLADLTPPPPTTGLQFHQEDPQLSQPVFPTDPLPHFPPQGPSFTLPHLLPFPNLPHAGPAWPGFLGAGPDDRVNAAEAERDSWKKEADRQRLLYRKKCATSNEEIKTLREEITGLRQDLQNTRAELLAASNACYIWKTLAESIPASTTPPVNGKMMIYDALLT